MPPILVPIESSIRYGKKQEIYDKLVETYDDLVKKMPDFNSATLENLQDNIIKSMKRVLDDAESSSASKRTNRSGPPQISANT